MNTHRLKLLCIGLGLFLCLAPSLVSGQVREIPPHIAMRVLIGEAADQGLKGMICVGEVLRRRGSVKGFHGYKSKIVDREPRHVWRMAAQAWRDSANTNYTKGADHFVSLSGRQPRWLKQCTKTYAYKDHVFYKYNRRRG